MNLERALEKMDRNTRDIVKLNIEVFKRRNDYNALKEAVAIILNYCDEDEEEVIQMVKKLAR